MNGSKRVAVVTGATGQDGAYLAAFLLEKGYRVFGTFRRTSSPNVWRLEELALLDHPEFELVAYDLTDFGSGLRLLERTRPDEVYNLAAQSFVGVSFDQPLATAQSTGLGVLHLLEAVRTVDPSIRFYQASTSEMFGHAAEAPQTESTAFHPRSPYGIAKLFAHWSTLNYRDAHGLFAASGIAFNHESPLRGCEFVTRKITDAVGRIETGALDAVALGNLDARRDWGFAPDYVEGMWRMLQKEAPDTYVLATHRSEPVRRFVELAFEAAGTEIAWDGEGVDEVGRDATTGQVRIRVDPGLYRPAEVDGLLGDPTKARRELGWEPTTSLERLAEIMVEADLRRHGTAEAAR